MKFEIVSVKVEIEEEGYINTEPPELCVKNEPGVITVKQELTDDSSLSQAGGSVYVMDGLYENTTVYLKDEACNRPSTSTSPAARQTLSLVKQEPESEEDVLASDDNASMCNSDTAEWSNMYAEHKVKDGVMLSPESIHRPQAYVEIEVPPADTAFESNCQPVEANNSLQLRNADTSSSINNQSVCGEGSSIKKDYRISTPNPELLEIEHSFQNYICPDCDYMTADKKDLQTHLKSHIGQKQFNCNQCNYSTCNESYFKRHANIHTTAKRYKCSYCDLSCHRKTDIRNHEMTHTGEKPYKCNICDYQCTRKGSLLTHERKHTGDKLFKCNECNYKCPRKDSLIRHQLRHASEKPYQCNLCDFKSYQKAGLRIHERIHTGEKSFECEYCEMKFRHRYSWQSHLMIHTGEKPYHCNNCNYSCSRQTDLRKHQAIHSDEKPFKCSDCDYRCRQRTDLRKHQKIHSRGLLQCSTCDYKCRLEKDLRVHRLSHAGVALFKCDHCNFESLHKYALQRHLKALHCVGTRHIRAS